METRPALRMEVEPIDVLRAPFTFRIRRRGAGLAHWCIVWKTRRSRWSLAHSSHRAWQHSRPQACRPSQRKIKLLHRCEDAPAHPFTSIIREWRNAKYAVATLRLWEGLKHFGLFKQFEAFLSPPKCLNAVRDSWKSVNSFKHFRDPGNICIFGIRLLSLPGVWFQNVPGIPKMLKKVDAFPRTPHRVQAFRGA